MISSQLRTTVASVSIAVGLLLAATDIARAQAPAPSRPEPSIKVFTLVNAKAHDMATVLVSVIKDGRVAVDERTNAIILSGDAEALRIAEALIMRLDAEAASKQDPPQGRPGVPSPVLVRLIWMVSGLEEQRSAPAKDLKPIVSELAKLGIDNLQVVANALVNVRGNEFTLLGTPELEEPVRLEVTGILDWNSTDPHPLLNIDLDVRDDRGGPLGAKDANSSPRNLVRLSSAIDAPYGQFVVLGAAPLGKLTSVFVLQVVPK
jgi:hypothetical protein